MCCVLDLVSAIYPQKKEVDIMIVGRFLSREREKRMERLGVPSFNRAIE
jgi:hypothetical protein